MTKNKTLGAAAVLVVAALLSVSIYLIAGRSESPGLYRESDPSASINGYISKQQPAVPDTTISLGTVTKTGTVGCLKQKDTSGTTTMECANGITTDDGTHYALFFDDPTKTSAINTGERVRVSGALTQTDSKYDIVGTIKVQSLQQL